MYVYTFYWTNNTSTMVKFDSHSVAEEYAYLEEDHLVDYTWESVH